MNIIIWKNYNIQMEHLEFGGHTDFTNILLQKHYLERAPDKNEAQSE